VDIEQNMNGFFGDRDPPSNAFSFDYCFNYFQSHWEQGEANALADGPLLETSCLQLGFYLASWGMLRGSSQLLSKSMKHFAPIVKVIAEAPPAIWEIDANGYSDESITTILSTAATIRAAFPHRASDILVSKILLGVFGCVPAFDTYFNKGFGVATLNRKALLRVGATYQDHAEEFDRNRPHTLDFSSGTPTERLYTRAKVIDMVYFVEGRR